MFRYSGVIRKKIVESVSPRCTCIPQGGWCGGVGVSVGGEGYVL